MNKKMKPKDLNVVKEVWRFMLTVDEISQQELIEELSKMLYISRSNAYQLIKLLSKPIQTNLTMKEGVPQGQYIEPLILPIPTLDRKNKYVLTTEWRENITADSGTFEKTKRFY